MKLLVSACLVGVNCKYSGGNNYQKELVTFLENHEVFLICPEEAGGLSTPRIPCEIVGNQVLDANGKDVSDAFACGAQKALDLCQSKGIQHAILKERSPSCGVKEVYDGTFSHTVVDGMGICAKKLAQNGISLCNEYDFSKLDSIRLLEK
ncbi:MAG: DUF523 domain-containing protein [Erysipelotrichaceae bacterium]